MSKSSKPQATLIAALLILTVVASISMPNAFATITGRPTLYTVSSGLAVNFVTPSESLVQTIAYGTSAADMIAINMTGMTLTGAQIWLWLSPTGGATIEANDQAYAGPFLINNVTATVTGNYTAYTDPMSGKVFYVGNSLIIGMIPTPSVLPTGTPYWVKITDVAPSTSAAPSSDVAVSNNQWKPLPTITVTPLEGPAGTNIMISGVAFTTGKLVNITFGTSIEVALLPIASNGTFQTSFFAPDLKDILASSTDQIITVYYNDTGSVAASVTFSENGRQWLQVASNMGGLGTGINGFLGGDVETLSTIVVTGNYFNPRGNITLTWDWGLSNQVTLGTVTPNATGYFNTTVVIPISSLGDHSITAADFSYNLNATVSVVQTVVLTPTTGPIGTVVTVDGYGFPYNSASGHGYSVTIWWNEIAPQNVSVTLTNSLGRFTASFTVPHDFGGDHTVSAVANNSAATTASATFTVTPTIVITPSSVANNGTTITVTASGLAADGAYSPNIDNNHIALANNGISDTPIFANATGDLTVEFVAAGFQSGLHVFSMYPQSDVSPYVPTVHTTFNITGASADDINRKLDNMNTTLTSMMAVVTSIQGTVATIQTNVGTIQGTVTSIQGTVATIQTNVGTIQADVSSVKGTLPVDMTPVWIAVGLSLIAAIAAAIAAVGIFRKMA